MRNAKWITGSAEVPVLYKDFSSKKPEKAVLKVTACGVYEAKINGKAVSEDLLRPGWTNYRKRIQVQSYDVTALLEKNNRLEITVAPGWWAGYLNGEGKNHHYGDRAAAWAELTLSLTDGTERLIVTDESWQYTTGPIRSAELYHGEVIDYFPFPAVLPEAEPVFEEVEGWKCDISGCRKWEDLPEAARKYVEYVEKAIGCHIGYVSVGPERDAIIIR